MKRAVIFDMDGTLWDAVDNIAVSWNAALRSIGIPDVVVTRERIIGLMGQTMDRFAEALLPMYAPEEGMEILQQLEQVENGYLCTHGAKLLGDVEETFRRLREMGCFVGIVSNSQSGYIEAFLEHYHIAELVDDILSYGDTQKEKADNLRFLIERNGLNPAYCRYVGDTDGDLAACRAAGVPFVWAAYGFGSVEGDVPRIDSLEEIVDRITE